MSMVQSSSKYQRRKIVNRIALTLAMLAMAFGLFWLLWILWEITRLGVQGLSLAVFTQMTPPPNDVGGLANAIYGSAIMVALATLIGTPIGIMAGIYLNEYMKDSWFKRFVKMMTNNLAGVPSIVFGLFGMSLFVNTLEFGDSILAGSLTLSLLALPVVIRVTEEALLAVDQSFRQGSLALGATKLQTIRRVVLPIATPNIITGLILSVGRVSGETAPILFTVAAYFLPKLPSSIFDQVMALPYHLYVISTSGTDIQASRDMAYGTALVLVMIVLLLNLAANALRRYFGNKVKMN